MSLNSSKQIQKKTGITKIITIRYGLGRGLNVFGDNE